MTITTTGFTGTVSEKQIAQILALGGVESAVAGAGDWAVTVVGGDRKVSIAAGVGYATFVRVESDAAATVSIPTPAAGRFYVIVNRVSWQDTTVAGTVYRAHTSQFLAIPAGTTTTTTPDSPPSVLPDAVQSEPGVVFDVVLAWVWVNSSSTTVTVWDRRPRTPTDQFAALRAADAALVQQATYTPVWGVVAGSGNVLPTMGASVLEGHSHIVGNRVTDEIKLIIGAGANKGVGPWTFRLSQQPNQTGFGAAYGQALIAGVRYPLSGLVVAVGATVQALAYGNGNRPETPPLSLGDTYIIHASYDI